MENKIPLETGLCWYYDNIREIREKNIPEDKSYALAVEYGIQIGKAELKERVKRSIKLSNMDWDYERIK